MTANELKKDISETPVTQEINRAQEVLKLPLETWENDSTGDIYAAPEESEK